MAHETRRFLHTQQATVVFKGVGQDVHVILDPHAPFPEIDKELREHLERSGQFFEGAAVTLIVGSRQLRDEHLQTLRQILTVHGLSIAQIQASLAEGARPAASPPPSPSTRKPVSTPQPVSRREQLARDSGVRGNNALLIKGTLRSGQRIHAENSLVAFGAVNPGAEVIAGGDIMVIGTLRGVAHAGVPDNVAAIITALSLQPTQLRIGHFITRSPEFQDKHDSGPEIAKVDGQQIVVESFLRRLLGAS